MTEKIPVLYENGVFRPLRKVNIKERTKLEIVLESNAVATEETDEATTKLLELLERPYDLGSMLYTGRSEIYDDAD